MKTFTINNIAENIKVYNELNTLLKQSKLVLLTGEMGSGKTTFTSGYLQYLNAKDKVSSPTYSLVNEYIINDTESIYHFDLYRIKNEQELLDMGINDYLMNQKICFIEWPQLLVPHLQNYIDLTFEKLNENTRLISINIVNLEH